MIFQDWTNDLSWKTIHISYIIQNARYVKSYSKWFINFKFLWTIRRFTVRPYFNLIRVIYLRLLYKNVWQMEECSLSLSLSEGESLIIQANVLLNMIS